MRGTISKINHNRGCGFILPDPGEDNGEVHFEREAVHTISFGDLSFGARVIYEMRETPAATGERQASRAKAHR